MGAEWAGDAGDRPQRAAVTSSARWRRIWTHQPLLLRVARRCSVSAEDAEDAVQEAMLRAAERPEIEADRLRAWLVTATKRLCIDRRRQQAREARRCAWLEGRTHVDQQLEEDACGRAEAAWMAARANELLPARQAQALRLTAAGCDVQQVAGRLGVGHRAAESLLARARRTLRAVLGAGLGVVGWACRPPLGAASGSGPVALAAAGASCVAVAVTVVLMPAASPPPSGMALPPAPPTTVDRHHAGGTALWPDAPLPAPVAGRTTQQPVSQTPGLAAAPAHPVAPAAAPVSGIPPPPISPSAAAAAVPHHAAAGGGVPGAAAETRRENRSESTRPQRRPAAEPYAKAPAGPRDSADPPGQSPRQGAPESGPPPSPRNGPPPERHSPGGPKPPARPHDEAAPSG